MRKGRIGVFAAVLAAVLAAVCSYSAVALAAKSAQKADSVPGIPGLPTGVPAAAIASEPALPEPSKSEWPFPSNFSHTSGTGLLSSGASLWTDFVYDDHGPLGSPVGIVKNELVSDLAPVHGGFAYPEGPADNNGADIFTAAVGYSKKATYWRVDWNTLANPDVPVAEWTFATGSATPAATEEWPANAHVSSSGVQYALVVSAEHAQLIEAATGKPVAGAHLQTEVNDAAKSFVVRIPTSVLPVSNTWQVRLAAGLANAEGTEFATVGAEDGGIPDGTNVYNVTFRSYEQEKELVCPTKALPDEEIAGKLEEQLGAGAGENANHVPVAECGNMWMENDQANTLATGNVSKYALSVNWSQLQEKKKTPEPEPTGYSNRWYVTPLKLGEGVIPAPTQNTYTGPTYLGRVQPYAVYVPSTYNPATPAPLTWVLHSLGANMNQYGGVAPSQLEEECQDRGSICATTEGFSDGQWYYEDAQVDFWNVWHQLAEDYNLDPDSTVMSGYSMGGWASYKLTLEYPDLFAQSMPLEGPVICGTRVTPPFEEPAGAGQCTNDGNSTPLVVNAKWVPYVMTYGMIDELVPFTGGVAQVEDFNSLGYRYYAVLYPAEDHMVFSVQNDFSPADSQLAHLQRAKDPGSFTFTWYPELVSSTLGIGPSGDYWVSGLRGREAGPGKLATVKASSGAIAEPEHKAEHHTEVVDGPTPAVGDSLTWVEGAAPATSQTLTLSLEDVAAAAVHVAQAQLRCASASVTSDGATELTLLELKPGSQVSAGGSSATANHEGAATLALASGTSKLQFCGKR